ncbi:MAG TPA: hypothetical protein VED37_09350, partial [Ktedonobacteraceae bacterium]|nr:hypothetical protein [Ktedonobacteraceae bacterium]
RKRPAAKVKNGDGHHEDGAGSFTKLVAILLTTRKLSAYSSFWKEMKPCCKATAIDRNAVEIR